MWSKHTMKHLPATFCSGFGHMWSLNDVNMPAGRATEDLYKPLIVCVGTKTDPSPAVLFRHFKVCSPQSQTLSQSNTLSQGEKLWSTFKDDSFKPLLYLFSSLWHTVLDSPDFVCLQSSSSHWLNSCVAGCTPTCELLYPAFFSCDPQINWILSGN